jgi:hypothetical protein
MSTGSAAQIGQQFLAQRFIGVPRGGAAGLGAGNHAFQQRPAALLARRRAAHSGPEKKVIWSGCWPAGK